MTIADRISGLNIEGPSISKHPNACNDGLRKKLYSLNCFKCPLGTTVSLQFLWILKAILATLSTVG